MRTSHEEMVFKQRFLNSLSMHEMCKSFVENLDNFIGGVINKTDDFTVSKLNYKNSFVWLCFFQVFQLLNYNWKGKSQQRINVC